MKRYSMLGIAVIAIVVVAPVHAIWDPGRVVISPFIGYGTGGDFNDEYNNGNYYGNIDLGDSGVWGLRMGVGIARGIGIEWQISHMPTAFYVGDNDSFFDRKGTKITDTDLFNVQASMMFDLVRGPVVPYVGFGLGATMFNMDYGQDKSRFSASLAGGLEFRLNKNLYFRTEIRGYGILIEDNSYYDNHGYYNDRGDEVLSLLETTFGLSFRI